jgi:DHA2 family multidrug resistance protein-like MFS transporter
VFTLATDLIVGSAPAERAGAAAAISETASELGGALGIAVLGSLGAAVYRAQIARDVPPGIGSEAAAVARDTLGGAVHVATLLPDQPGSQLLLAARDAFASSIELTAATSTLIALGLAVASLVLLRAVPSSSSAAQ